ncbi:MAG: porin [Janthinobacterium lividum]
MRKLLLATVALLGASMGVATVADAQTASPAPGTVTVRLNGRFRFYGYAAFDRDADNNAAGAAAGAVNAAGVGSAPNGGSSKQANYGFGDYARLYPGFDGVAANGLKYGASLEIRQDQVSGAGGGVYGSISAQNRARGGLYFRREWGYLGTDQLGTIRLGSTDQPSSLYMTGNFENFDGGGLNGDIPSLVAQNTIVAWPFGDVGGVYTTMKAVYLSPQLFGFDMGASFEPNTGNVSANNNCGAGTPVGSNFTNDLGSTTGTTASVTGANTSGAATTGCDRLSSTYSNAESFRRRNTLDALLRYRGTFGGFGVAATAGYITSGNVKDNQTGVAFNSSRTNGLAVRDNVDGLSIGDFGVALSYAGFSVGGKYQFGRFNGGSFGLVPKGLPDGEAWLVGASYTIGPVVVGAHYLDFKSAGDIGNAALGRQRREHGLAAGATYSVAPGVSLFLSGLWSERKQNGFNFNTGQGVSATAVAGNAYSNKVTSSIVSIGTSFSW